MWLTLARKFDAVHKNTVIRSKLIPKVLRANLGKPVRAYIAVNDCNGFPGEPERCTSCNDV